MSNQQKLMESLSDAHVNVSEITAAMVKQHALAIGEVKACHAKIQEQAASIKELEEKLKAADSKEPVLEKVSNKKG